MNVYFRTAAGILGTILFLFLYCLTGCEVPGKPDRTAVKDTGDLRILTWNVQTLFDGDEAGNEYDEYRGAAGWTEEKYKARLHSLAQAINRMSEQAPDILGLMEIENPRVLDDLIRGPLAKKGYNWNFFGKTPQGPLGIGILSRFPFEQTLIHSITRNGETAPRPLLEAHLRVQDKALAFFVCHWKSKLGGDDATEPLRKAEARILLRRLKDLKQTHPDLPVIIMGDLNENHDEFYRREGSVICALLPDDPHAAERAGFTQAMSSSSSPKGMQTDFLILSRKKPPEPEYFAQEALVLYSPWTGELAGGSYNHKNAWETIDHFLLSGALFDRIGWDFDSCKVIQQEPFITGNGYPSGYNSRTGNGLSDHLPLLLTLKDAGPEM
ncbi:MAG: endonuclease/exonuclease/phosphatase family protein [Treponema sp.]|jgi:endonuclease/exonuclease/phosphatase family metal-dependent hydrolase|nr:endonuclease/exonuclease/phosphatase family protein [Treponema sp.]